MTKASTVTVPCGKNLFGWKPSSIAGGVIADIVQAAKDMGLSGVSFKVASGVSPYPYGYDMRPLRDAFGNAGIAFSGWHYVYGVNAPASEAALAGQRIAELELDSYEIDAEAHYKNYAWTRAAELVARIKEHTTVANIPLGLTTYRYPQVHPEFPWRGFLCDCDYWIPQVYWQPPPSSPIIELDKSISQWTLEAQKWDYVIRPFIPAGRVYIGDGYPPPGPTSAEIVAFLDHAKNVLGLHGATFWSFDNLYTHTGGAERMATIANFNWHAGLSDKEKLDRLWEAHPELWTY